MEDGSDHPWKCDGVVAPPPNNTGVRVGVVGSRREVTVRIAVFKGEVLWDDDDDDTSSSALDSETPQDLFLTFAVGDVLTQTSVHANGGAMPDWKGQEVKMELVVPTYEDASAAPPSLVVQCWIHERSGKHRLMGATTIDLPPVKSSPPLDEDKTPELYTLHKPKEGSPRRLASPSPQGKECGKVGLYIAVTDGHTKPTTASNPRGQPPPYPPPGRSPQMQKVNKPVNGGLSSEVAYLHTHARACLVLMILCLAK
jgi:hypothetical protein